MGYGVLNLLGFSCTGCIASDELGRWSWVVIHKDLEGNCCTLFENTGISSDIQWQGRSESSHKVNTFGFVCMRQLIFRSCIRYLQTNVTREGTTISFQPVNLCPCNRPWRTIGLWDVEAPTFSIQSAQTAVRLSALRAGRPLPPRKIPGTHFC
jgi:hypothetical protein